MCAIRRDGAVRRSRRCFPASSISICGRRAPSFACVMEVRGRLCSCFMAIPTIMCFGMRSLQNWRSATTLCVRICAATAIPRYPIPAPGSSITAYALLPKTISGAWRDYRAGATINFEMDAADKDKKIATPLLVLWGTRGAPPTDEYPTIWRKFASNLETIEPLATGHYIQEEMPEQCLDRFFKFFVA